MKNTSWLSWLIIVWQCPLISSDLSKTRAHNAKIAQTSAHWKGSCLEPCGLFKMPRAQIPETRKKHRTLLYIIYLESPAEIIVHIHSISLYHQDIEGICFGLEGFWWHHRWCPWMRSLHGSIACSNWYPIWYPCDRNAVEFQILTSFSIHRLNKKHVCLPAKSLHRITIVCSCCYDSEFEVLSFQQKIIVA